jgi:hypothetical protein
MERVERMKTDFCSALQNNWIITATRHSAKQNKKSVIIQLQRKSFDLINSRAKKK